MRMRHDDQRAARSEERAFDHELFRGALLVPRLPDNRDVEATGDATEQIGRAGEARIDRTRLGRNARCLGGALKARDRLLGGDGVAAALRFDEVGRNAAEHAAGDDRLVDKGGAGDVRAKTGGERDRVVRRKILRVAARQVGDDVLDHGPSIARFAGLRTGRRPASEFSLPPGYGANATSLYFFWPSAPNPLR